MICQSNGQYGYVLETHSVGHKCQYNFIPNVLTTNAPKISIKKKFNLGTPTSIYIMVDFICVCMWSVYKNSDFKL